MRVSTSQRAGISGGLPKLVRAGHTVFSQVSMSHPINAEFSDLDKSSIGKLWAPIDQVFMEAMTELVVIDAPGWKESSGVAREIAFFEGRGRPVVLWSSIEADA